jgi:hypothetical protein
MTEERQSLTGASCANGDNPNKTLVDRATHGTPVGKWSTLAPKTQLFWVCYVRNVTTAAE